MPSVFATGFLVGLIEWACVEAVNPFLDFPHELTVGTHIDVSHEAPTPPGIEVTAHVMLAGIYGRHLCFDVEAKDETDTISRGKHERAVVDAESFVQYADSKGLQGPSIRVDFLIEHVNCSLSDKGQPAFSTLEKQVSSVITNIIHACRWMVTGRIYVTNLPHANIRIFPHTIEWIFIWFAQLRSSEIR